MSVRSVNQRVSKKKCRYLLRKEVGWKVSARERRYQKRRERGRKVSRSAEDMRCEGVHVREVA